MGARSSPPQSCYRSKVATRPSSSLLPSRLRRQPLRNDERKHELMHSSAVQSFHKFAGYSDRTFSSHASVLSDAAMALWHDLNVYRATGGNLTNPDTDLPPSNGDDPQSTLSSRSSVQPLARLAIACDKINSIFSESLLYFDSRTFPAIRVSVMPSLPAKLALATIVAAFSFPGAATKAAAQTYPIDCAILLCLSGGWPASVPCARARAEFIRRITPWPVEPPLQIWRCPMGASYLSDNKGGQKARLYDILLSGTAPLPLPQSLASEPSWMEVSATTPAPISQVARPTRLPEDLMPLLIQDQADIDISGPAFDFVRSIRVFDVSYARQEWNSREGECRRRASIRLGSYGAQGDFSWAVTTIATLPEAHSGLEAWGQDCPRVNHRSVFVEWRDSFGDYGFEQVNY